MNWTRRSVLRTLALSTAAAACAPSLLVRRPRTLRLVFYADVHARDTKPVTQSLERAAAAIAAERADLVVAGGDLVDAGTEVTVEAARPMWSVYRSMAAGIGGRVRHVIGNHDLVGPAQRGADELEPRSLVLSELGLERTYGSFEASGYHVVVLDSVEVVADAPGYRGYINAEQRAWLAADLAAIPAGQPVIVATHIPLLTAVSGGAKPGAGAPDRVVVNAREVLDILASHRVILVLQAHLHRVEEVRLGGTTFLTGGAICGQWWRPSRDGAAPGFVVASLDEERVVWKYVTYPARVAERPDPVFFG